MGPEALDLRSDTVTLPTAAMREAMFRAELGDDVFGEDPTVIHLERMAAERMGKEAAVFVASGTMGNLISLLAHCRRGDEAIVGDQAHVLHYEVGAAAGLGGIQLRPVANDARGMIDPAEVEATIRGENIHYPRTALLCLENTHNRCGGSVLTREDTAALADLAHRHEVAVYLDGARIFNAAIALGIPAAELARDVDSVSFCLSKGLSAPVGSLVCGTEEFVAGARKARKMVGGGMRQVGVIAAAGIVALETMVDRLAEDHETARILARGLAELPGLVIDPASVQTNIVLFDLKGWETSRFFEALDRAQIKALPVGPRRIRMVTHYGVTGQDIEEALERLRKAVAALV
jgi:threonine aldolase